MIKQQHLLIKKGEIGKYVLLPGDPARVDFIATFLEQAKVIASNREFRIITGFYKGVKISVVSTGIGCPSTAIAVEEAINAGAKVLIRTGTCGGSWRKDIPLGSLIIPTACVRDEGTTKEYILPEFPAVADFEIVNALKKSARMNKFLYFIGINRTHDAFYCIDQSIKKWGSFFKDPRFEKARSPIISSEMEAAALFVIGSLRNVKVGAILAVDASPVPLNERIKGKIFIAKTYDDIKSRNLVIKRMIITVLEAVKILNEIDFKSTPKT